MNLLPQNRKVLSLRVLRWAFLACLAAAAFGLSIWGWIATDNAEERWSPSPLDLATRAYDTVVGEDFFIIETDPPHRHGAVDAAGVLGNVLIVLIALQGIEIIFQDRIDQWRFRRKRGFFLIVGLGERGSALGRRILDSGERLAVIEVDPNNEELGDFRNRGALVIIGSGLDPRFLDQAGVHRAHRIIIVAGTDQTCLAIWQELATLAIGRKRHPGTEVTPVEVVIGVESAPARNFFRDRMAANLSNDGRFSCRMAGFQSEACRQIVRRLALDLAESGEVPESGCHILIEASDDLRDELVRAAGLLLHLAGDNRLRLTVARANPEDEALFRTRYPELDLITESRWITGQGIHHLAAEKPWGLPDICLIANVEDSETLETADRLLRRLGEKKTRVVACLRDTGGFSDLALACSQARDTMSPIVETLYEFEIDGSTALDPSIESEARSIHEAYHSQFGGESWDVLPEHLRDSNRLAAFHNAIKRKLWERLPDKRKDEAAIAFLARSEHLRWMAEKVFDGWRIGPRNDFSRTHPNLVPFEALSDQDQLKDVELVRKALSSTL